MFSEKGYERATTAEIAHRLGISEATVFSYFRGKRELCARVIGDWYDEIIESIESGLPRDGSVRQQFAFIVRTHLRRCCVNGTGLCSLVLSEGRTQQHELSEALTGLHRRYTAPLSAGAVAGGKPPADPRGHACCGCCARSCSGPWSMCCGTRRSRIARTDIDATAERLIDVLWSALQPPDASLAALAQFRHEVSEATRRLAEAEATHKTGQAAPRTRRSRKGNGSEERVSVTVAASMPLYDRKHAAGFA